MSQTTPAAGGPLTVVLVHGAFADASGWTDVCEQLQAAGVQVIAPANPLRGISIDSAYIASVLAQIPGPVLAVGHSYGGAVISNAATGADNVVGLVFVAGFAPEEGERLIDAEGTSKDSVLSAALVPLQYPTGQGTETAVEFAINPTSFHDAFASDLPAQQTAMMAATQRPVAEFCVLRTVRTARLEDPARLGRSCNRRQGGRRRRHPFDGTASRRPDHRSGRLTRDHDVAAADRQRRDSRCNRQGQLTQTINDPRTTITLTSGVPTMSSTPETDPQPTDALAGKLKRTEIQHKGSSIPGREIVQVLTEIPCGVESGWHIHPGEEVGYIVAGTVEMMIRTNRP